MAEPALALQTLSELSRSIPGNRPKWCLKELEGRLVEISDPYPVSALSFAFLLVHEIQARGECVAWVGPEDSMFYPPDVQASGINLKNLPVLRMPDRNSMGRATEMLMRSGAFRLVVLYLGTNCRFSSASLSRLNALARRHKGCVLFITEKANTEPSIGSLISLRIRTSRNRTQNGEFLCQLHTVRDKIRGENWIWQNLFFGVEGF